MHAAMLSVFCDIPMFSVGAENEIGIVKSIDKEKFHATCPPQRKRRRDMHSRNHTVNLF